MTTTLTNKWTTGSKKRTKAMVAGLLVMAAMSTSLILAADKPAGASTTFTVNIPGDTKDASLADNLCDVNPFAAGKQCTLRAAIEQANATTEADTIRFNIPDDFGSGVKTINVGATGNGTLPAITRSVTIDGYTQPGASPNTKAVGDDAILKIVLDGSSVSGRCLELASASDSVIRGLVVNHFSGAAAIDIHGVSAGNRIEGNFIGTNATGTLDKGNLADGVLFAGGASDNVVGGDTLADRNVISGNDGTGVTIDHSNGNLIANNYIGTDKSGTKKLGNAEYGVFLTESSGNTIGGTTAISRNVVSDNGFVGVSIFSGSDNKILGNRVGTTANGTGRLGNLIGVAIGFSEGNSVGNGTSGGANTVAFNSNDGVEVDGGSIVVNNRISRNSIFSNGGLGIDLGSGGENTAGTTPNDPADADSGTNTLQNFPVLSSAKTSATKTTIKGRLNSTPSKSFKVQFFSNPSGTDEGKKFIGQKKVSTASDGKVRFTFSPARKVGVGQTITATATGPGGNTSEFSAPKTVVAT